MNGLKWRQRHAAGDVILVRYADDTIVGFEHRHDAERFLADLSARLAEFGLRLHPEKTRLIEFGRHAIANRRTRGLGKPETFAFLGFTHYCATRRGGSGYPAAAWGSFDRNVHSADEPGLRLRNRRAETPNASHRRFQLPTNRRHENSG